jgi:hypothetical protein
MNKFGSIPRAAVSVVLTITLITGITGSTWAQNISADDFFLELDSLEEEQIIEVLDDIIPETEGNESSGTDDESEGEVGSEVFAPAIQNPEILQEELPEEESTEENAIGEITAPTVIQVEPIGDGTGNTGEDDEDENSSAINLGNEKIVFTSKEDRIKASGFTTNALSLNPGDQIEVTFSDGINVRTSPCITCSEITDIDYVNENHGDPDDTNGAAPQGTRGTIQDGPVDADGYRWYKIEYERKTAGNFGDGKYTGWSADGSYKQVPSNFDIWNDAPYCDEKNPRGPAVRIHWGVSTGRTGYTVYRNGSIYENVLVSDQTFLNNLNVSAGSTYEYFVRARNSSGDITDTERLEVTIPANICSNDTPPQAPTDAKALVISSSDIAFLWQDNADNETGFKIYRSQSGGSYSQVATYGSIAGTGQGEQYNAGGLQPDTNYCFRVYAYNNQGDSGYSQACAKTKQQAGIVPTVTTQEATNKTQNSATLNGTINPNGEASAGFFRWGTTESYGNLTSTGIVGNGTSPEPFSQNITGLQPNTTYHFQIVGTNSSSGSEVFGDDRTFTTLSSGGGSETDPILVTNNATGVACDFATLNGMIDPKGTDSEWYFQWGKGSNNYFANTAKYSISGNSGNRAYASKLSNLENSTTYYYRIVLRQPSTGNVFEGEEKQFTTSVACSDDLTVTKEASVDGVEFKGGATVFGGEKVYYRVIIENTGSASQNTIIKDRLTSPSNGGSLGGITNESIECPNAQCTGSLSSSSGVIVNNLIGGGRVIIRYERTTSDSTIPQDGFSGIIDFAELSTGASDDAIAVIYKNNGAIDPPSPFTLENDPPECDTKDPAGPAVRLKWEISQNATSYEIYRDGVFISNQYDEIFTPSDIDPYDYLTFLNNDGLVEEETYTYYVKAINSAGKLIRMRLRWKYRRVFASVLCHHSPCPITIPLE